MNKSKTLLIIVLISAIIISISCKREVADLVLLSGKVATVDKNFSIHEAIAVNDNKFIYIGDNEKAEKYVGENTNVIDLEGKLVLPGLIDAHAHMNSLGNELSNLNITGSKSFKEIVDKVAEKVKTTKPGEWIIGGRWDQTLWENKSFPVHYELSKVSPDNPIYLTRVDGNSAFVNAKALEMANISNITPDPEGG